MRLPAAERAVIDVSKVLDYLLSREHPVGRFKAAFFSSLGYIAENAKQLETDLRRLTLSDAAELGEKTVYGQKYEIRGTLEGPAGREAEVATVWIVLDGEDFARFVTAFPGDS